YLFLKKISTEAEGALDPYSPWFSKPYYRKAKKRAQQANIIMTNHALLCTDIYNDNKLIPAYKKVVIDEAHHFEDTAARHYGLKLDYTNMQYTFNQIGHSHENKLLGKALSPYVSNVDLPLDEWDDIFDAAKYEAEEFFRTLYYYVLRLNKNNKGISDIGRIQYRYEEDKEDPKTWGIIKEMATRVTFYLRDLIHVLSKFEQ